MPSLIRLQNHTSHCLALFDKVHISDCCLFCFLCIAMGAYGNEYQA